MQTAYEIILSYMTLSENKARLGYAALNEALKLSWYDLFKKTKECQVKKKVKVIDGIVDYPCNLERLISVFGVDHCGDTALLYEDTMKNHVPINQHQCGCNCDHSDCMCSLIEPVPIQSEVIIEGTTYINKTFTTILKNGNIVVEKHTWVPTFNANSEFTGVVEVVSQETKCKLDVKPCGCPINCDENAVKLFKCGCIADSCVPTLRHNNPLLFNGMGYYSNDEVNKRIFIYDSQGKKSNFTHVFVYFESNGSDMWVPMYAKSCLLALLHMNKMLYSPSYSPVERAESKRNYKYHLTQMRRFVHPIPYQWIIAVNDATKRPIYNRPHSDFLVPAVADQCPPGSSANPAGAAVIQNINNVNYSTTLASKGFLKVIAGAGEADSPVVGSSSYQNDKLKMLGLENDYRIEITVDAFEIQNWGQNASFTYDPGSGTITFPPGGYQWLDGASLKVDLNQ